MSFDLDFFTDEKNFNEKRFIARFADSREWKTEVEDTSTIYGELCKSKVSFIAYPFFLPRRDFLRHGFVNVLNKVDIAVMKIIAISQRGRKRDFFDLYWCAHHVEPLLAIIKKLPDQYPSVAHDYHHILKSLVYFADAEVDPAPKINFAATWNEVKKFFEKEIPVIVDKLI